MNDYININNIKINYFDNKKKLPPIVFLHGNSQSSSIFINQLEDPVLIESFRLLAIDLPGHGRSEKPVNPEEVYSIAGYGEILKKFCEKLNLKKVTFVGFSLGGHILLEALYALPASGIVITGTPPISKMDDFADALLIAVDDFSYAFNEKFSNQDIEFICAAQFSPDFEKSKIPKSIKNDLRDTDGNARVFMGASLARGGHKDEKKIIEDLKIPIAIIHGRNEILVKESYLSSLRAPSLWKNEVCVIKDAGHAAFLENPETFNKTLFDFANSLQSEPTNL